MRGFTWCVYVDDIATPWAIRVDADHMLDPGRGWSTDGVGSLVPLPRLWRPRRVVGIDLDGRTQSAVVASVDAPLWTGVAVEFEVEANDNTVTSATVIARQAETRLGPSA